MKTTLLLGLFTGSILAATTGEGIKPASKDASALSSLPKDALSLSSSGSPEDWCGGFSAYQCAVLCGEWNYRCYYCSASFCNCVNTGC
ncbi:hypothetical protein J3459_006589 [Metarhizium acridum]|uniref:uncharacterized protein n=1 Tax=Metarhizium acridum TaxID=92637 RepID=UPI001C6B760B|nr:hypothetical protein J3458_005036 [Metarhizium acridum]KAG8427542.1 hypothetical protein J3459_006621 [Metarhizium acridum]KAG8427561.1 hypothetical protein J3459_006589 [Metarhizium acridum]